MVSPLLRFDTNQVLSHGKLVAVPVPVRLPRVHIDTLLAGEEHMIALTKEQTVYEWGVRHVIKVDPLEDLGLCNLASPVKLELPRRGQRLRGGARHRARADRERRPCGEPARDVDF